MIFERTLLYSFVTPGSIYFRMRMVVNRGKKDCFGPSRTYLGPAGFSTPFEFLLGGRSAGVDDQARCRFSGEDTNMLILGQVLDKHGISVFSLHRVIGYSSYHYQTLLLLLDLVKRQDFPEIRCYDR